MKKLLYTIIGILLLGSCGTQEDVRVFSPKVEFEYAEYTTSAEGRGIDIVLTLSHPAQVAFNVGLNVISSMDEGRQYSISTRSLAIKKGEERSGFSLSFVEDEIWDEKSLIKVSLLPGERYTVDPDGRCEASVKVTKAITVPAISIIDIDNVNTTNPYLAETLHFALSTKKAPSEDLEVEVAFSGLVPGKDFLINGEAVSAVTLPMGETAAEFELNLIQKDESGLDEVHLLSIVSKKGSYVEAGEPVSIRFYDPIVNLQSILKTAALNNGEGYQIRQAIRSADGSWNGNTALDMIIASESSNYLSSRRNLFYSQWLCKVVSPGSNALRLTEFFPAFTYPEKLTIADYAASGNARNFSACDSLLRFTLDYGSSTKGSITNPKPRTLHCYIAERTAWEEGSNPAKAWQLDSKSCDGDIDSSASDMIKERVEVMIKKIEGRFDLENSSETMMFTAWIRSDSQYFMNGVDFEKLGAVKDGDCWKVEYKLWPR